MLSSYFHDTGDNVMIGGVIVRRGILQLRCVRSGVSHPGPLTPSNDTAIVRGKNDTTGVTLVEVYNVSP